MHPTNNKFEYDRTKVPLYFCEPSLSQKDYMLSIHKEYYSKTRDLSLSEHVPLTNGMTTGEFAMHTITVRHYKRNNKKNNV